MKRYTNTEIRLMPMPQRIAIARELTNQAAWLLLGSMLLSATAAIIALIS